MLFSGRSIQRAIGEASTSYLYDPKAPERIAKLLGNVKIIIILRNPVARAYSAWGHNYYQVGYERLSFEKALQEEAVRMVSQEFRDKCPFYYGDYHYFHQGLYYESVKRYCDTFGWERVKVYIFEEFAEDPARICRDIFSFLGVDPNFRPVFEKHNVAPAFGSSFIHRFLVTPPPFIERAYHALPMTLRVLVYRAGKFVYWLNQQHAPRPPLGEELQAELMDRYLDDMKRLEELLEKDLSIWYSDDERSTPGASPSREELANDLQRGGEI
jgi:hypothetical protein